MESSTFQLRPSRTQRRDRGRCGARTRAFTLMELIMGMIVTGLVMSAIAALLSAVAMGWEQNGKSQASSVYRVQTHARIQRILKGVKQLGAVRTGSVNGSGPGAGVMVWKSDDNGDNKVQFSELALLVHEGAVGTADGKLSFYDVAYPSHWTQAQCDAADNAPPLLTQDDVYKDSSIDTFRTMAYVHKQLVASNLVGVVFTRTDGADITRPSLDYVLKFDKDNDVQIEYGTTSVRTPTTLPANQRS